MKPLLVLALAVLPTVAPDAGAGMADSALSGEELMQLRDALKARIVQTPRAALVAQFPPGVVDQLPHTLEGDLWTGSGNEQRLGVWELAPQGDQLRLTWWFSLGETVRFACVADARKTGGRWQVGELSLLKVWRAGSPPW